MFCFDDLRCQSRSRGGGRFVPARLSDVEIASCYVTDSLGLKGFLNGFLVNITKSLSFHFFPKWCVCETWKVVDRQVLFWTSFIGLDRFGLEKEPWQQ